MIKLLILLMFAASTYGASTKAKVKMTVVKSVKVEVKKKKIKVETQQQYQQVIDKTNKKVIIIFE